MGSKNISLREDAYERLKARKREGESFTDVVNRLTEDDKWSGFGALSGSNVREGMERAHNDLNEEMQRDIDEMSDDEDDDAGT